MTTWNTRPTINTTFSGRNIPGENCMEIIETGLYDDTKLWSDEKIWWDAGSLGTSWNTRPLIA